MGAFNTVRGRAVCPNCANVVDLVAQFKYGCVWQIQYQIGDILQWGRNEIGNPGMRRVVVDAVAEAACPVCAWSKEWDLYVHIERDKLIGLETASGEHNFAKAGANFIVIEP